MKLISILYLTGYTHGHTKEISKHLLHDGNQVSREARYLMANVTNNKTDSTPRPLLDRLTHSVIKETSKNL